MVSTPPHILVWPLLAAVFFAPAAATRCSDAMTEMGTNCLTSQDTVITDLSAFAGFDAFCGKTACTSALRNVRLQCPSLCAVAGTTVHDNEDQARRAP
jgi:hypothetical protein